MKTLRHSRLGRPLRATLAVLLLAGLAVAATPDPAAAYLADHPGGRRVSANEIRYGHGLVVTLTRTSVLSGPDCPAGWFCFYDGRNYGYPRGKLSDCGWQDLGTWGWRNRTESVQYNLLNGSVVFLDAGASPVHTDDKPLFSVSAARPLIADVSPYRNMADYVYRYC